MVIFKAFAATLLVSSAWAHTIMHKLYVNGADQGLNYGIRVPTYDGPITDVTSNSIICNGSPNAMAALPSGIINIPAGASVAAEFYHGANDPIDPSHKGPISVYLAKIPSATQTDVTGLSWFKIYEDGLHSDGTWAVDTMISNGGKTTFTIPSCIANGNYLLRTELIALHGASSYPGAQFYIECAQVNISGGAGSASPATVSLPGAYAASHPGVTVNIYYPPLSSYSIPGPRPFTCSGGGQTSTIKTSSSSTRSSSTSSSTRVSSSSSSSRSSSTSSSTGGAPLYGQCGGQGWTGPTTCSSGTCKVSSQYYSQCLP